MPCYSVLCVQEYKYSIGRKAKVVRVFCDWLFGCSQILVRLAINHPALQVAALIIIDILTNRQIKCHACCVLTPWPDF